MVHARAFSFYDDAVSVALPSPNHPATPLSGSGSTVKTSLPDASVPLFKLRQLQSNWYQTLFQCDPNDPLPDATAFIWQKCFEMRQWSETLPGDMAVAIREMLDLELRYSYVYCIHPSARAPHLTVYGQTLIFEHAIAYVNSIYEVANAAANRAFYTYHDALRVYFMGSQFVAVLRDAGDLLLSGSPIPMPLSMPGKVTPPPLPDRLDAAAGDNLDRSLQCLERVRLTLQLYGQRWGNALSLRDDFEMMSAEVLENLNRRRAAVQAGHGPTQPGQSLPAPQPVPGAVSDSQHQHVHQPQLQSEGVSWADMEISHMMGRHGHM